MVIGLDKFREHFAGEEDKYIIIGGTACDVNLRDTNTEPRDTVDIDIILIFENMTADFGRKFWKFIDDGGTSFSRTSSVMRSMPPRSYSR